MWGPGLYKENINLLKIGTYRAKIYPKHISSNLRHHAKVITLNINEGYNKELMEQCRILREYAQYVAKVREYAKEMELDAAVEQTIKECIREGILAEFLRRNKSEVVAMSIFEYDKEEEEKKLRKAEYEYGFDSGYDSGYETGELQKAKEVAGVLNKTGMPGSKIAEILGVSEETVQEWLEKNE